MRFLEGKTGVKMATILDTGLLRFFLPAFTFLFILIILYAILKKVAKFEDRLSWVAAFSIAIVAMFSGKAIDLINFITPWFVVIFVFLFLVFMGLMFWGVEEKKVWDTLGGVNTIVIVTILVLVIGISQVFGPVFSPYAPGGPAERTIGGEAIRTIFHPRVLGAIFILIVAAFAIQRISETEVK